MNIFALDNSPIISATYHCDKHVVKMIVETAQMLSTAHRVLDGTRKHIIGSRGRHQLIYDHPNDRLYRACFLHHPCTQWVMENDLNYKWASELLAGLIYEYTYRYGKSHKTSEIAAFLMLIPDNIPKAIHRSPFAIAMGANPECINKKDPIGSYRSFYIQKQKRFSMTWKKRKKPDWFIEL